MVPIKFYLVVSILALKTKIIISSFHIYSFTIGRQNSCSLDKALYCLHLKQARQQLRGTITISFLRKLFTAAGNVNLSYIGVLRNRLFSVSWSDIAHTPIRTSQSKAHKIKLLALLRHHGENTARGSASGSYNTSSNVPVALYFDTG